MKSSEKYYIKLQVGDVVGKWTILKDLGTRPTSQFYDKREQKNYTMTTRFYLCQCTCGITKEIPHQNLQSGQSKGCQSCAKFKHGLSHNSEYKIWGAMIQRCCNSKNKAFDNYGGRGIKVCKRWLKFENFFTDMGLKPTPKHSLDRIDNNGNYELANCRWATRKEQNSNTRLANRLTGAELARITGYTQERIRQLSNKSKQSCNILIPFIDKVWRKHFIYKPEAIEFLKQRRLKKHV